jgi:hypothetical protein
MSVVRNPSISRDVLFKAVQESYDRVPTPNSLIQQWSETLKHLRILEKLGYLDPEYATKLPPARREVLAHPSSVTQAASLCSENNGSRTFDQVYELVKTFEKPVSRDAVYYQYVDALKVRAAVKQINMYRETDGQ